MELLVAFGHELTSEASCWRRHVDKVFIVVLEYFISKLNREIQPEITPITLEHYSGINSYRTRQEWYAYLLTPILTVIDDHVLLT